MKQKGITLGSSVDASQKNGSDNSVSVIIPVYNRSIFLREAVESALMQSYRPIEILIVDDGSTDEGAIREIAALSDANPDVVRSLRIPNSGPGFARQTGLDAARGEFIQFLDSDDLLLPGKLALQVAGLQANAECALSYGKMREVVIGESPRNIPSRRTGERYETLFPAALQGRLWATETPLYRRAALDRIGRWSDLRILEDWEYECRLGAWGAKLHYCDAFVSEVRHHDGAREGLSWQRNPDAFRDMLTAHRKVLEYAMEAGIEKGSTDMHRFARNLFRLARLAGTHGLADEAGKLLDVAVDIDPAHRREYKLYKAIASRIGWKHFGVWCERAVGWRKSATRYGDGAIIR